MARTDQPLTRARRLVAARARDPRSARRRGAARHERDRAPARDAAEHRLAAARDAGRVRLRRARARRPGATGSGSGSCTSATSFCSASTSARSRARTSRRSSTETGETATLSVAGDPDAVTIDFVPARHDVQGVTQLGRPSVAHATAAGKVMLAFTDATPPAAAPGLHDAHDHRRRRRSRPSSSGSAAAGSPRPTRSASWS